MRRVRMPAPTRSFGTAINGRDITGGRPVPAGMLRYGQHIGGRRIVAAPAPVMVSGQRAVKVLFDDRTSKVYLVTELVAVTARLEVGAGPVKEGWSVTAPRKAIVDPAQGKWRGEHGRGNSRRIDMVASMAAYDAVMPRALIDLI